MEASCEGGQGPEEAAAPYMELHILRETQTEREGERERQMTLVVVAVECSLFIIFHCRHLHLYKCTYFLTYSLHGAESVLRS
jgi:hypothetical protein